MAERARGGFASLFENTQWMQKSDILMGIGVVSVVVMLIIPLPTFLLDFLLAISIMSGLLILMIVMFIGRTFDFSIFPSLLLITTVFRLALNVSSTRLILLQGAAFDGKIIRAFGEFVVGGNTSSALSYSSSWWPCSSLSSPRAPRGRPRSPRASRWTPCPASR